MSPRRAFSNRLWQKRLLDYAYLCAEEALEPAFFDECVKMLADDYDTIVAIIDYDASGRLQSIHQSGLSEQTLAAYVAHYYRTNIYAQAIERLHLENVTTTFEGYIAAGELHRTEYYNDFLRPLRVEHVLALGISGQGAARTSVTLYRNDGGEAFDREDVQRFDRLRPFLKSALTMRKLAAERQRVDGGTGAPADRAPAPELTETPAELTRVPSRWGLTPRETDVALALADGLSYKEVAFKLGLSFHTVNDYVDALHRKLNLSTARIIAALNRRS